MMDASFSWARRRKCSTTPIRPSKNLSPRNSRHLNPTDVMKETNESKLGPMLGLFFALAAVLALIMLEYLGSLDVFHRGYHVHALFKNVQDLKVGDTVRMAGVHVGRVEQIILTNAYADVTLNMN